MICSCKNDDKEIINKYIGKDYPMCLYLYLDLNQFDLDKGIVRAWYQLDTKNEVTSVALNYHTALHIFSHNGQYNKCELLSLIKDVNPTIICAIPSIIKDIEGDLASYGFISEIGHIGKMVYEQERGIFTGVQKATLNDVDQIASLLYNDNDIGASYNFEDLKQQMLERLSSGFVRSYVIRDNNKVVAHLGTGAEVNNVCTIAYVITDPEYRGRGLAKSLFHFACKDLSSEGKKIYSVYYPEASRALHHKMGFVDYCEFGKLFRKV